MPVLKKLAPRPRRKNFHNMTKGGRRHCETHKRSTFDTPALMPMVCASALGLLVLGWVVCLVVKRRVYSRAWRTTILSHYRYSHVWLMHPDAEAAKTGEYGPELVISLRVLF